MSVSNGQRADQTTFNNAFLSKVVGGETVGVIDLNNTTDPNSGAQVPNTQRAVNELYEAVDTQLLVASTNAIDALAEGASLRTLSGTTSPATDLGTFTGTTITDAVTVKAALQELETAVEARILLTEKGAANGVATLDAGGKIPTGQIPASFVSLLGDWDASTNTPTLANGVGDPGDIYRVSVAGTVNFGAGNISFSVGDWVYYRTDNVWDKTSNVDAVTSVNGLSGTVTLDTDDIGEGTTNLYFTNARVDTQIDARRGVANGVASLDASTLVPIAQIPDITTAKVTDFGSAFDTRFDSRIPTKSIDVLSDVDTTTVAPAVNDLLKWNGTNWVPSPTSAAAPLIVGVNGVNALTFPASLSTTETTVVWPAFAVNTLTGYNISNGVFTAPFDGMLDVSFSFLADKPAADDFQMYLKAYLNASPVHNALSPNYTSSRVGINYSHSFYVPSGFTLYFNLFMTSSTATYTPGCQSFFMRFNAF
jgi:hypothetical protein